MPETYEPDRLHYYHAIDAWVLVPEAKADPRPVREILEEARRRADALVGKRYDSVDVDLAEPITLGQFVPVFRESIVPPPVESDEPLDHLFARSDDPFCLFVQENVCVLDTQIEMMEKRKRRLRNGFRKDPAFRARLRDHDLATTGDIPIPAPVRAKVMGYWESYRRTIIQHHIADDVLLTIDDPRNFAGNQHRALIANASSSSSFPQYAYLNAMGDPDQGIQWQHTDVHSWYGSTGVGVPIVVYSDTPRPWKPDDRESETGSMQQSLAHALRNAMEKTEQWLQDVIEGRKRRGGRP